MQNNEDRNLTKGLKDLNREVSVLRKNLNEINSLKEKWFNKKEELKKEVSALIKHIKVVRERKDKLNKRVKELKKERDDYHSKVKERIEEFKKLDFDKKHLKEKIREANPAVILENIEKLEMRIETEALSFKKEKEVMKEINALKRKYNEAKKISNSFVKGSELSKDINEIRKKAEELHSKVKQTAEESQKDFDEIKKISSQIDELNKKQEEAFKIFTEKKDEFTKLNLELEKKLEEATRLRRELNTFKQGKKKEKRSRQEDILKVKAEDIEEKIKTKKKLTKDDLLVFQSKE